MTTDAEQPPSPGLRPIDPDTVIETARLQLAPVAMRWAQTIFSEFTPAIARWMSPAPAKEIAETEAFIREAQQQRAAGTDLVVVLLHKQTGEYLGNSGVHGLHKASPALGLWVKQSAHGNGYGLEAIGGLIDWVRRNYAFSEIRYAVDRDNFASRRIPEHYGGKVTRAYDAPKQAGGTLHLLEYVIPLKRSE